MDTRLHHPSLACQIMSVKVVLITGAGQRLGAATARRLIHKGCHVLLHVRSSVREAEALLAQAEANEATGSGEVVVADLTDDEALQRLVSEVAHHPLVVANGLFGVVHNASLYRPSSFAETPLEVYRHLTRLHMDAPYAVTQGCLEALKRGRGSVIGMVDTSWGRVWGGLAHYTSTKAGLRQLMLNLAGDLAPEVRVNCVAPGAIMAADWEAEHFASVVEKVPLQRSGQASDIAAAIDHLLHHPTLTGHVLHVDGGWSTVE